MMFTIILMITIQREKKIVFDDIIADIITNKKFQLIILLDAKN